MKTTIDIPDELARQAKALAAAERTTLRELVVEGLRAELTRRDRDATPSPFTFTTVGGHGLHPDVEPGRAIELGYGDPA